MFLELREQIDEVMNAAIGLLRARLQQVVKLLIVPEDFFERKHGVAVPLCG
jgi:hypothetical protein